MKSNNVDNTRWKFLGTIASGVAVIGVSSVISPLSVHAESNFLNGSDDPEQWFKQIKGKHRIVFDVPQPNEIFGSGTF